MSHKMINAVFYDKASGYTTFLMKSSVGGGAFMTFLEFFISFGLLVFFPLMAGSSGLDTKIEIAFGDLDLESATYSCPWLKN